MTKSVLVVGSGLSGLTHSISNALPDERTYSSVPEVRTSVAGVWQCGDFLGNASIEGAMLSGRLTAEAILENRNA